MIIYGRPVYGDDIDRLQEQHHGQNARREIVGDKRGARTVGENTGETAVTLVAVAIRNAILDATGTGNPSSADHARSRESRAGQAWIGGYAEITYFRG